VDAARRSGSRQHARGIGLALQGGVDPILAVKFAVALLGFWMLRGYATEGRNYVRAALALPAVQGSDLAHAHALYVGAGLADSQGSHAEARRMLEKCLELRRRLDKPIDIAAALSTLSLVRFHAGDAAGAREGEAEAVDISARLGNRVGEAIGLLHLAEICIYTVTTRKPSSTCSTLSRSRATSRTWNRERVRAHAG